MANTDNNMISLMIDQALKDHAEGTHNKALIGFQSVLQHQPTNVVSLYMLGVMHSERQEFNLALQYLNQAIAINGKFAQFYQSRAVIYSKLGQYKMAFQDTQTALSIDPHMDDARKNYNTLQMLAENTSTIKASTSSTIKAKPVGLIALIEQSNHANTLTQIEQTIQQFQDFLSQEDASQFHLVMFSIGVLHHKLNRHHDAEAYFRHALLLKSDFFVCHFNLGLLMERCNRSGEAVAQWELALKMPEIDLPENSDDKLKILTNLGRLLEVLNVYDKAENALKEALRLDPDNGPVLHHWIHLRQKQCRWPINEGLDRPAADVLANASPIAMLGLSDDPAAQLNAGRHFVETKVESHARMVPFRHDYGHHKLRIGYLSSNLSMHAVSLLTVELFETHDRQKFEIHAFCWSPEDGTPFRNRVLSAFDHVHRVSGLSDMEVAELIRSQQIDIIIDLQGLTSGARPNIVARGPAPIQVAYLGYPGPSALPYVDYIVADSFIMPPELCEHFTEKPLYLPSLFQVSDSKRQISAIPPRSDFGFDESDFIFCAFNNNHKFTPELFGSWMRILRDSPKSLLWLLEDNQWSKANLLTAAAAHGVGKNRLRFAGRITPADYLARFAVADLFLDTMPYNAGTTANDALWAGLPLLTLSGHTYVSRMAGSLLKSIGLDELITFNAKNYEETAIRLAKNTNEIKILRERLHDAKANGELFNTDRFTREFETALQSALKG